MRGRTTYKISEIHSNAEYHHSQTPRPPCTYSTPASVDSPHSFFAILNPIAMNDLLLSLSSLSEAQLRKMVTRVASKDPYFCDVIAMELGELEATSNYSDIDDVSATTPITGLSPWINRKRSSRRRANRPRTLSNTFVHFPPAIINTDSDQEEYHCYHSGHLETEQYEFLTGTTGDRTFGLQTVFMWTCCEGDEMSPGCTAPTSHHGYSRTVKLAQRYSQKKSKPLGIRHRRA